MRIPPEVAAKHFIKAPKPQYPSSAEMARIQGNVVLEIGIDESGRVSVRRVVSGHPMLVPAAIEAVNQWKYEPPLVEGKPTSAVTDVLVAIPDKGEGISAQSRAELAFQNDFWTAEEAAEAFLAKQDYPHTEEQLNKVKDLVPADKPVAPHLQERWQWMTIMGRLRMSQKKYEEAGQYFKDALALRENNLKDQNAPEIAISLANLGALYAEEKQCDLAHENGSRALAIYQKNFKKAKGGAQQAYGQAVASESRILLKVAQECKDAAEVGKQCQVLKDFQAFLSAADRESVTSACQSGAK